MSAQTILRTCALMCVPMKTTPTLVTVPLGGHWPEMESPVEVCGCGCVGGCACVCVGGWVMQSR